MTEPAKHGFGVVEDGGILVLTLSSHDKTNRLTATKVIALTMEIRSLGQRKPAAPLVITGEPAFSAGADLNEIARLDGPSAVKFAKTGQELMNALAEYPARVYAAIRGYCMGGGLDLALACHHRIASTSTVFGHRGAALGLMTGWGGTQRLPRLVGKGRAMQMFTAAEKLHAAEALQIGLIDAVAQDPLAEALRAARSFLS
jgi:enoyl-CoA hydratase